MDRRHFIKLTAVTGGAATLASCGSPEAALIRFVPDEDLVPGVATWKPGVCPLCAAGCGTIVRVMEGDAEVVRGGQLGVVRRSLAKKLEGHPAHPISAGTLCVRGQAALQLPYHPDRIRQPLQRTGARGTGPLQPIAWDAAIAALVARLDGLSDRTGLAYWTRPGASVRRDLVDTFLARFGAPPSATFALFDEPVLRQANQWSFGHAQLPTLDLGHTGLLLSFGADLLGTWNTPVAQSGAYGRMRQGRPGIRGAFIQVEPRLSLTGASADQWVPLTPGTEGVLALGLAHVLLAAQLKTPAMAGAAGALIDGWAAGLPAYTPARVAQQTGVSAAKIERLAHQLVEQTPAVAIIGGAPLAHTHGLFQALAVNALTALLGSVGQPGGLSFMPQLASTAPTPTHAVRPVAATLTALQGGNASPVQVLIVDGVDPVYGTPAAAKTREALLKIPYLVSVGSFLDDTSSLADLILPDHTFAEGWTDARPEAGATVAVWTVAPPAMPPLYDTRATAEVLLDVSRKLQTPLTPALPATFVEALQAATTPLASAGTDADAVWSTAQTQGGWWGAVPTGAAPKAAAGPTRAPRAAAAPRLDGDPAQYPFAFLPYASQTLYDGSLAHLPWLQECPDPLTSAMWSNWVELHAQTAATLGIHDGDLVDITSSQGTVRAPAVITPGIAPDVIAMPVGQGHTTFTRYASGRGSNPVAILAPLVEPETGALAWAATRVKIARAGDADGSLIPFAGESRLVEHER